MKAWRVVEYDGVNGAIWIAAGVIGLVVSLAESGAAVNTFALVIFGVLVVSLLGFTLWIHSRLRGCADAPAEVVMGSRLDLSWRLAVGAFPAGVIVYLATVPGTGTWLLAIGYIALGTVMGSAAVRAARIERRRGGRVVRAENRFFLAH
jgi:hypothetical protein